jgi:hypothetical protein
LVKDQVIINLKQTAINSFIENIMLQEQDDMKWKFFADRTLLKKSMHPKNNAVFEKKGCNLNFFQI